MTARWMSTIRYVCFGHVLTVLLVVGCGPSPDTVPAEASGDRASSVAGDRAAERESEPADTRPVPASLGAPAQQGTAGASAASTASPAAPTPTSTPAPEERPDLLPIHYHGYPCDPYSIDGVELWFWENTVRWVPDGSAVFFSQGPAVYGAAVDGAWARAVADASGRPDPRLRWHPQVRRDVVVGPMTYFDVSPDGDRLVYATCAYREEAVTGYEQTSAEMERQSLMSQGYRPQYTGPFVPGYELALVGLDGGSVKRLTTNTHFDNFPSWSPDGTRIVYLSGSSVRFAGLVTMIATGGFAHRIDTGEQPFGLHPPQWSPDGTRLAVVGTDTSEFRQAVLTVNADGTGLRRLGRTISGPSWSPDGRRLAFVGAADDEGDGWSLLTMAANGTDVRRVPTTPGWEPHYVGGHVILTDAAEFGDGWIPTLAWSPAGAQLLYTCGRRICVVALDGTPVGRSPIELESGSVAAWSPDGTRIAVAAGAVWDTPWLERLSGLALYTMAPDGTDVRVLASYDFEGRIQAAGTPSTGG